MADFRAAIAKEFSSIPRPKVSKPFNLAIDTPEVWDETKEVGVGWKIEIISEEARMVAPH